GLRTPANRHGRDGRETLAGCLRPGHVREPEHHLLAVEERRTRERIDAAGKHQLRAAGEDVADARVDRLHAGGAIAHHRPARHFLTAAHAQRRDAADVHLVYRGRGAAEDDLVELARGEGLAYEQRAPGLRRQIAGGEWPGAVARLEKRRACAVDDVNRLHAAFTMGRAVSLSASAVRPKSCGKSSTLMTLLRSASFFCHCAYSSALMRPWSLSRAPTSAPGCGWILLFFHAF